MGMERCFGNATALLVGGLFLETILQDLPFRNAWEMSTVSPNQGSCLGQ
jgi:hypothetical protein